MEIRGGTDSAGGRRLAQPDFGEFAEEEIETVKNFANVKDAAVNKKASDSAETVLDIYFGDMDCVFQTRLALRSR